MLLAKLRHMFRSRRGEDGRSHERGGGMVELALLIAPLMTISLSVVELGLLWQDSLLLHQASRSGARVAAALVNEPSSDREALRAVVSHLDHKDLDDIQYVVIYRLDASGNMPAGCETASQSTCNYYSPAALSELDNDSQWECGGGALDSGWCPTTRNAELHSPIDVGVLVVAEKESLSGFFPTSSQVSAETVMRLNPLTR